MRTKRTIEYVGPGWYSLDDDGVYRIDTEGESLITGEPDGSPGRATYSRIRILGD